MVRGLLQKGIRMKNFSRRKFLQSGALAAAAVSFHTGSAMAEAVPASGKPSPVKLGLASYTFRNFTRAQMIGFMKQLNVTDLNCKDAKDHLPMDPAAEAQALADYAANGIKLHAVGTIYFPKDRRRRHPLQVRILQARGRQRDRGRRSRSRPRCRALRNS